MAIDTSPQPQFELTEEEPKTKFALYDDGGPTTPLPDAAARRAAKTDYALGAQSPGPNELQKKIETGQETDVRQGVASMEDLNILKAKQIMIQTIAQKSGRALTEEEMNLVYGLTKEQVKTDPATVLETKFAEKYVSDVMSVPGATFDQYIPPPVKKEEERQTQSVVARQQFFQHGLEGVEARASQRSWWGAAIDMVAQAVPFLPWVRQKYALENRPGVEFLPGDTLAANVRYLHALPFDQAKREYAKALKYLEGKNFEDALMFARAMVSFTSSDEFLASAMGVADYSTLGGLAAKAGTKLFGKSVAKAIEKGAAPTVAEIPKGPIYGDYEIGQDMYAFGMHGPIQASPWRPRDVRAREAIGPDTLAGAKQDELFPDLPAQGGLFGPRALGPEARKPGLEPGRLRSTYEPIEAQEARADKYPARDLITGRMVRRPVQQELDLVGGKLYDTKRAQGALDLQAPKPGEWEMLIEGIGGPGKREWNAPKIEEYKRALIDVAKAVEDPLTPGHQVLAATGNVAKASVIGAGKRLENKVNGLMNDLADEIPTFANPAGFLRDSKVLSRDRAQALETAFLKTSQDLFGLLKTQRPARLTPEALEIGKSRAEQALRDEWGGRHSILDVVHYPADIHPANVDVMALRIGKPDKNLFASKEQAELYAKDIYGLEAKPAQQGTGWYLEAQKVVKETDDVTRDALITPKNTSNLSLINMLGGRFIRSANDIVSAFQRGNRSIATHAPQEVFAGIKKVIDEEIQSLPAQSKRDLNDILRLNRDIPSIKYPGERGRWYDTAGELEQAWLERHKRLPNEAEIRAYDAYRRVSDFDWVMRNVDVYRDKARVGVETFQFRTTEGDRSRWFEGIEQKEGFPWRIGRAGENEHDAGIFLYDQTAGKGRFLYKNDVDAATKKEIDGLIANEGYKVIQVDPKAHAFQGLAKTKDGSDVTDQIHYVITNTVDRKPLEWQQVDYRPGGHVVYPKQWYVAQPVIQEGRLGKMTYYGDNVALNIETQAEAKKWTDRMNDARILLRAGKDAELDAYLSKNLPYSTKEFRDLFQRKDSPFSLDTPIVFKEGGRTTFDSVPGLKTRYKDVIDGTKNPYDLTNMMDRTFLQDRDNILNTIKEGPNGVLTLEKAEQLDPFIALQRGMAQAVRNTWVNDYKIGAIESWRMEFKDVMRPSEQALENHPMYFLYNPQWNENTADKVKLAAAKATRQAIINFIGTQSEFGSALRYLNTKLMDGIYTAGGQGALSKLERMGEITESWGLASIKNDPANFLRGVAFHSKLGFGNPVQLFIQAQSLTHAIALAPEHGFAGFRAAWALRRAAHNPDYLDNLGAIAGWSKSEFRELYDAAKNSGVFQVAGEAALRDDAFDPKLFQGTVGWMLDKGAFFFNEGERMVRLTAFSTAYREFKAANKGLRIGNQEMGQIMDRYRTMTVDMTRDANAWWQDHSLFKVPTQFFAFNARLADQLLGGRLTGMEKARVLLTNAALYGVPVSVGSLTLGTSPVPGVPSSYEDWKAYAFQNNINISTGFMNVMTEGLLNQAVHYLTGKDYNIAARYGPGASTAVGTYLKEDKKIEELVLGASGTIIGDFIRALRPLAYKASEVFGDGNNAYPLKSSDWMGFFRNISTMDTAAKVHAVIQYGKWRTKSGTDVGKADGMDAAMAVLGLTPLNLSDTYIKAESLKDLKKSQAVFEKEALENWRRGLQAASQGDYKGMGEYFTRANTALQAGDFNYEQKSDLMKRGMKQGQDLEDKVNWDMVRKSTGSRFHDQLMNFGKNK